MLSEREKMIGARLRAFREMLQIPRTKFALSIGCGSEQIAAYESGRARLPYRVFQNISKRYDLHPGWLNDGNGVPQMKDSFTNLDFIDKIGRNSLFTYVFDRYLSRQVMMTMQLTKQRATQMAEALNEISEIMTDKSLPADFRKNIADRLKNPLAIIHGRLQKELRMRGKVDDIIEANLTEADFGKNDLTDDSPKGNNLAVKSELDKLIARVKRLAARPGAKAELARVLEVAPARITEWLTDDKEKRKEPGGHYTLELLKWVEQQERQK